MTAATSTSGTYKEKDLFRTVSWTALLAGTLDICSAIIKFYIDTKEGATLKIAENNQAEPVSFFWYLTHGGPDRILKYIARGAFDGSVATSNPTIMVIWGLLFHYLIAFLFTTFLFLLYPAAARWVKNKFLIGLLYGLFTWTIMNLIVVPLSRIGWRGFVLEKASIEALILICMIGMPVALIAHHYYSRKKSL